MAGEASGNLDDILYSLSDYLQKQASLRGKLSAALTYPAIMIGSRTRSRRLFDDICGSKDY